jgi:hypothetical protein
MSPGLSNTLKEGFFLIAEDMAYEVKYEAFSFVRMQYCLNEMRRLWNWMK